MPIEIEGMMSPQQAALRQAEGQLKIESILDTITAESQKIADASQGPSIIPGTGGKTPGMLMQESQARLQAQTQVQKIAQATDWENLAVTLGQDIAQLAQQQRAVTDKIVKDSAVSFFDDPLTALANAFTLPWDEQALEGINTKLETTTRMANAAHNHVQQSAVTADKIKTEVTKATLAEQATALENWQTAEAAKARIDAAKTGADAISASLRMDKDALNIYMNEVQLRNSEESMAMARRNQARQDEMWQERQKEKKDKEIAENEYLQYANLTLKSEGKAPLASINDFNKLKGMSAKYLDTLIRRGFDIYTSGNYNYSYGSTIESRLNTMNELGFKPDTDQQINTIVSQDAAYAKFKATNPQITDKKAIAAGADKLFEAEFRSEQKNIGEGSKFAAPAFSVYAETPIARDVIWQKYIAPTLTDATKDSAVTPDFVLGVAKQALRDKTVSSAEAVDFVNRIFKKAVATNNTVHKFDKIAGMEQTEYGTTIVVSKGVAGFFQDARRVDMLDPVSVSTILAADIKSEILAANPELARITGTAAPATANINAANLYPGSTPFSAAANRKLMGLPPINEVK